MATSLAPGHFSDNRDTKWHLLLVTPDLLATMWDRVVPLLLQGRQYWEEFSTIDALRAQIEAGQMQLWLCLDEDGPFIGFLTQFDIYPKTKVCRIVWISGQGLSRVLYALPSIEIWAKRQGASRVEVLGRVGWIKLLENGGYELKSFLLAKDLSGMEVH